MVPPSRTGSKIRSHGNHAGIDTIAPGGDAAGGRASAALARTPADAEVVARVGLPVDPRGIALCHEEDRRATVAAPSRSAPAAIAPLSALAACAAPLAGSAGTAGTAVPAGTAFRALSAVSAVAADEAATLEPHRKKREPLFRV